MEEKSLITLPILPLKNVVTLPRRVTPIRVARTFSVKTTEYALKHNSMVFVTAQRDSSIEEPFLKDIYTTGVISRILQSSTERDGSLKLLVEGLKRATVLNLSRENEILLGEVQELASIPSKDKNVELAYVRQIHSLFKEYVTLDERFSQELYNLIKEINNLEELIDAVAIQLNLEPETCQQILAEAAIEQRAMHICQVIISGIEMLKTENNIRKRVQKQVEKHQKDYYLNEQMRAISKELGREDSTREIEEYRKKVKLLKLSAEAGEKVLSECKKLELMPPNSPEATVSRNYIDWLLNVPWYKKSKDKISLKEAAATLDATHAGMKKAKERILEFVAAKKYAGESLKKSPIICLIGPPGVGKTSLAETIAKSLGREFVKISLGGLRDEAEIRGHRRTYIGANAGKIILSMRRAGVINPVILLDEIDKLAADFRGDPAAALMEALDPEQNRRFVDHFLEVEYDLSAALFVATANVIDNIPYPLLDRMEIINLSGYTSEEKLTIVNTFLLPKLLAEHGLDKDKLNINPAVWPKVITDYTREAGVRQLSQIIAKLLRKSIQELLNNPKLTQIDIDIPRLQEWLGPERYKPFIRNTGPRIGVSTGLAWTESGGDVLEVETSLVQGKGALTLTGQLGEVMQESAQAALSYVRANEEHFGLKKNFYAESDIHIHVPEGAIPKDGPSAGITIATAMISLLTSRPVKDNLAMSGEITLRGRVLPVGGLKEKILAAIRLGLTTVIVPKDNENDIREFLQEIADKINIIYVSSIDQVIEAALEPKLEAVAATPTTMKKEKKEKRQPSSIKPQLAQKTKK